MCRNLAEAAQGWIFWGVGRCVAGHPDVLRGATALLPYVQLVCRAAHLIGIKLVAEDEGDGPEIAASDRLISAIKTVIIADLVMSLDNVIGVAAAAKGSLALLVFGLVISIPLVVVGAQLIMKLIERLPWLVIVGGGLLGYIAGEIAAADTAVKPWIDEHAPSLHYIAPVAGVLIVVAVGVWLMRKNRSEASP